MSPQDTGYVVDDTQIQAELYQDISGGVLPAPDANTLYMTYFPPGVTVTQGQQESCSVFCAYHSTFLIGGASTFYGVMVDQGYSSPCYGGCGGDADPFNNLTSTSSHEMIEATTDAQVGLATSWGRPLAWMDATNGEIGDICNAQHGTESGYTVQLEWSNVRQACITEDSSVPTPTPAPTATPAPPTPTPTPTAGPGPASGGGGGPIPGCDLTGPAGRGEGLLGGALLLLAGLGAIGRRRIPVDTRR